MNSLTKLYNNKTKDNDDYNYAISSMYLPYKPRIKTRSVFQWASQQPVTSFDGNYEPQFSNAAICQFNFALSEPLTKILSFQIRLVCFNPQGPTYRCFDPTGPHQQLIKSSALTNLIYVKTKQDDVNNVIDTISIDRLLPVGSSLFDQSYFSIQSQFLRDEFNVINNIDIQIVDVNNNPFYMYENSLFAQNICVGNIGIELLFNIDNTIN